VSIRALNWAWGLRLKPASLKFLLLSVADYADEHGHAYPSLAALEDKTCLDRKTLIAGLDQLQALGLLEDTGTRRGRTGQVKVYRLIGFLENVTEVGKGSENGTARKVPTDPPKGPENGTGPESGTVPEFPSKGSVFPCKGSENGTGNSTENGTRNPQRIHQRNHQGTGEGARADEDVPRGTPAADPMVAALDAWTQIDGVDHDAMREWIRYCEQDLQPPKLLGGATRFQLAKLVAGWGPPEVQRSAVGVAIANGWKNLRHEDAAAAKGAPVRRGAAVSAADRVTWRPEGDG
jgi:hypothetical protein